MNTSRLAIMGGMGIFLAVENDSKGMCNLGCPFYPFYVASQIKEANNTLFTNGAKVSDVVASIGDIHHIFPKDFLRKRMNAPQRLYNQVANYAYLEKRINIKIRARCPGDYFTEALQCAENEEPYFGNIYGKQALMHNLDQNCIPHDIFTMDAEDYERFLAGRRLMIAHKIKRYFDGI